MGKGNEEGRMKNEEGIRMKNEEGRRKREYGEADQEAC